MQVAWPRLAFYRGEVVKDLATLWCRLQKEEPLSADLVEVRAEVRDLAEMLVVGLGPDYNESEWKRLFASDPQLQNLFPRATGTLTVKEVTGLGA